MRSRGTHAAVLGDINTDISLAIDRYPSEGGDAQATDRTLGSGGGGLNAAVALRSLDAPTTLIGCVGPDPLAEVALATARDRGVDLSHLQSVDDTPTGTCVLITAPGGERTLLSHRGANTRLRHDLLGPDVLRDTSALLVFAYALLASPQRDAARLLLDQARSNACVTALDIGLAAARRDDEIRPWLPWFDLAVLNEQEILALTGRTTIDPAVDDVLSAGPDVVVVKLGPRGCLVARRDRRTQYEGRTVQAVDTTACGDAFFAVFCWMWACGHPEAECARTANLVGALTACRPGAADSIPTSRDLETSLSPGDPRS